MNVVNVAIVLRIKKQRTLGLGKMRIIRNVLMFYEYLYMRLKILGVCREDSCEKAQIGRAHV